VRETATSAVPTSKMESDSLDRHRRPTPGILRVVVQRIAYGTLAIAILVAVFVGDVGLAMRFGGVEGRVAELICRGSILPLVVFGLCLAGTRELIGLWRASGAKPHARFSILMVGVVLISPWLSAAGWLGSGPQLVEGLYWNILWMTVAVLGAGILSVMSGDPLGAVRDMAATVLTIIYLGFLPSFALQLRCGRDSPDQDGAWLLLITLLVAKASDIGAYFVGTAFGRHKLIPTISPGKSIEGMVGGVVGSALAGLFFATASSFIPSESVEWAGRPETYFSSQTFLVFLQDLTSLFSAPTKSSFLNPALRGMAFGAIVSCFSQFGDLVESCFKRSANVKDSGQLMPHFGGVLDLIDSPLFAIPAAWWLLTIMFGVI